MTEAKKSPLQKWWPQVTWTLGLVASMTIGAWWFASDRAQVGEVGRSNHEAVVRVADQLGRHQAADGHQGLTTDVQVLRLRITAAEGALQKLGTVPDRLTRIETLLLSLDQRMQRIERRLERPRRKP